mgnify:CR=1 FL=1
MEPYFDAYYKFHAAVSESPLTVSLNVLLGTFKTDPATFVTIYRKSRCISREFNPKVLIRSSGVGLYNKNQLLKNGKKEKSTYLLLFVVSIKYY